MHDAAAVALCGRSSVCRPYLEDSTRPAASMLEGVTPSLDSTVAVVSQRSYARTGVGAAVYGRVAAWQAHARGPRVKRLHLPLNICRCSDPRRQV